MHLLDVRTSIGTIAGYPLSVIEFVGIVSGVLSVLYARRMDVRTWSVGIINILSFFWIFYQVQLYAEMFLQFYFLLLTIYGWYAWSGGQNDAAPVRMNRGAQYLSLGALIFGTAVWGGIVAHLHNLLPAFFPLPAAFPYQDAFVASASVLATILLVRREIESWILWCIVDLVSVYLYFMRGIPFMALLYVIFLGIACSGLYTWNKRLAYG